MSKTVSKFTTTNSRNKKGKRVIIDGNNVAYWRRRKNSHKKIIPSIKQLELLMSFFREDGYELIVFISSSLKYRIDDKVILRKLIDSGTVKETPPGFPDDLFILQTAKELKAFILSNDQFREYKSQFPNIINKRRIGFDIIKDCVIIPPSLLN